MKKKIEKKKFWDAKAKVGMGLIVVGILIVFLTPHLYDSGNVTLRWTGIFIALFGAAILSWDHRQLGP